ncbi:minor capsid protein [Caldicoprobacter algeriensis]|uniref:minor capsid protein n=1 Tax=Caldicoprobacter algeriensis TaxID=699281 RepID=UPI002079B4C1|nr:minor capsid protein [Caldicoprobacter algeriensis]MCM8901325.1 minor capsid protein [Caldicoprobacter algeriensis]
MRGDADVLLDDIALYLQQQGVGVIGTDIFKGQMPAAPDNCIALFEYAGEPPDLHWPGEYPSLQAMVRNKSYAAGREKIEQIKDALHGLSETVINGHRYLLIQARQSPFFLERDENARAIFVCNFRVMKAKEVE